MSEHPRVTDVVKTATDIAFKYPLWADLASQHTEALLDGVGSRAFRSKTIGVRVGSSLRDWKQRQQVQSLHGTVFHRGDTQRSQLPVGLRDIDTPQRLRKIPAPSQCVDGLVSGRRCLQIAPSTPGVFLP
jgi:hypothetical protein